MASTFGKNQALHDPDSTTDGKRRKGKNYLVPSALSWAKRVMDRLEGSKGRMPLPDMSHCAVLLIDVQRIFVDPRAPAYLPAWHRAQKRASIVLQSARRRNLPVYWSRHVHPESDQGGSIAHFFGRLIRNESPWAALDPDLERLPQDKILDKARHPVFQGTDLARDLERRGCDSIVIMGVQAPLCVAATAAWAGALDLVPVVVADAVAAKNEREHEATLVTLAAGLAHVVTSAELLTAWDDSRENSRAMTKARH